MYTTKFARRIARGSGIVSLMQDLGNALNLNPNMLFLGGGNPASIPQFEDLIAGELKSIATDKQRLRKLVGVYQSPQGDEIFLEALLHYYRDDLGWPVSRDNIALASGSQAAFFILYNLLAGEGLHAEKTVCFPMTPEYLGYADQCLSENAYYGLRPKIELLNDHAFKYRVDFENLTLRADTAAICVSRPSNPTGNVISDAEVAALLRCCRQANIPLILDCAYGNPFPGICYTEADNPWQPGMVLVQSLSKLGLPGARSGIVIGDAELIDAFVRANTVLCLANGNLGPSLVAPLLQSGRLQQLQQQVIKPFYAAKRDFMLACIQRYFEDIPHRIHLAEGGFFVWLWLSELAITSTALYERCKQRGVLILPGEPFFFAHNQPWEHAQQCVRLSYCQDEVVMEQAIKTLAAELRCAGRAA